ncbi:MAG: adenylate/guanylate cyclase domain-containing protein, partial [bacterium]|nr:adenylate/guanylate cyclase domain-containing protein [bacterium]
QVGQPHQEGITGELGQVGFELCQQVGESPQLFRVLRRLAQFYLNRRAVQTARELGEQCLSLAQSQQDPALLLEVDMRLGVSLFWLGEVAQAQEHVERGIALYDSQTHHAHAFLYGLDPGTSCLKTGAR